MQTLAADEANKETAWERTHSFDLNWIEAKPNWENRAQGREHVNRIE